MTRVYKKSEVYCHIGLPDMRPQIVVMFLVTWPCVLLPYLRCARKTRESRRASR